MNILVFELYLKIILKLYLKTGAFEIVSNILNVGFYENN